MKKAYEIYSEKGRRIVKGIGGYPAEEQADLRDLVKNSARTYGEAPGFKFRAPDGGVTTRSYKTFDEDIDALGTIMHAKGLKGSRIAIISENRYAWSVVFFATVNGTGISVPLDKYLPKNELVHLLQRGQADALFFSKNYLNMVEEVISEESTPVKHFICFDSLEDTEPAETHGSNLDNLTTWIAEGKALLKDGNRSFVEANIDSKVLSILLFTSGTTNLSKGVMLSHENITSNLASAHACIHVDHNDVHLSLLPLHHTFENTVGQMLMIQSGACIAYCEGIKHIAANINEFGVTVFVAVPAILEAIYRHVQDGIDKAGKRKILNVLMNVSDALLKVGIDLRRILFKSVFEKLGPKLRLAVSGAAPLDPAVVIGFGRLGLSVYQGYGLTETSPVVAANTDFVNVPGSTGHPLADVEVTIDNPDENGMGEILTRGRNVMLGYYENEAATKEAIEPDGWFHTGDLGTIDNVGIIRITGRIKSMIVLGNGKKAFPEEFEVLINRIKGVKDSFAWGHEAEKGNVQICVKMVRDIEALTEFFKGVLPSNEALVAYLDAEIKRINTQLPSYKMIRYFLLTDTPLNMTTTLKIKRKVELDTTEQWLKEKGLDMRKASGMIC